jgi:hypothetical protein
MNSCHWSCFRLKWFITVGKRFENRLADQITAMSSMNAIDTCQYLATIDTSWQQLATVGQNVSHMASQALPVKIIDTTRQIGRGFRDIRTEPRVAFTNPIDCAQVYRISSWPPYWLSQLSRLFHTLWTIGWTKFQMVINYVYNVFYASDVSNISWWQYNHLLKSDISMKFKK